MPARTPSAIAPVRDRADNHSQWLMGVRALGTQSGYGSGRITQNLYDVAAQLTRAQRAHATALQQNYATYGYAANGRTAFSNCARDKTVIGPSSTHRARSRAALAQSAIEPGIAPQ